MLLEKDVHPHFHIGASLFPLNTALLDRLGLSDQVAAMGVRKPGAEFVFDRTGESIHYPFADGLDKRYTYSWQVRGADFDAALFALGGGGGGRARWSVRG